MVVLYYTKDEKAFQEVQEQKVCFPIWTIDHHIQCDLLVKCTFTQKMNKKTPINLKVSLFSV